ncbi:hypothetical protein AAKU55_001378 [Oxalobacteraceae bacterium GrIS 1.11]
MNTSTIAQTSPRRAECALTVRTGPMGIALCTLTVAALESWLRLPIQPLLDGYLRSTMSRICSVATGVFYRRSF